MLTTLDDWMPYLSANSGLPGPRGNLELVAACGEEADAATAERLIASGDEFATVCGLVALGRLLGQGDDGQLDTLHARRVGRAVARARRRRDGVAAGRRRRPGTSLRGRRAVGPRREPARPQGCRRGGVRAAPAPRPQLCPTSPSPGRSGHRRPGAAAISCPARATRTNAATSARLRVERGDRRPSRRGSALVPRARVARRTATSSGSLARTGRSIACSAFWTRRHRPRAPRPLARWQGT